MTTQNSPTINPSDFLAQVKALQTVNLPKVAAMVGLSWFKDLKPMLDTNPEFKTNLEELLEEMKYNALELIQGTGRDGKKVGRNPEITYLKAIIASIDSGELLGRASEGKAVAEPDEVAEAARLKRLGIVKDEEKKDT